MCTLNTNSRMEDCMNKIIASQFFFKILLIITLMLFIVPQLSGDKFLLFIPLIVFPLILLRGKINVPSYILYSGLILFIFCLIGMGISNYSQMFSLINFIVIIFIAVFIENNVDEYTFKEQLIDFFYILFFLYILFNVLLNNINEDGNIIFSSIGDKNYSAILVYLFFLYSNKRDKIIGVLFSFIYLFLFINSRSFILLLIMFYVVGYLKKTFCKLYKKFNLSYFKIMLSFLVIIMLFSVFWVYVVSSDKILDYHSSINDTSNRIRFVSNIYSFIFLFDEPGISILCGYGYEFVSKLGVDVAYSQLPVYLESKVLQPHNSYLNFMGKVGIAPGLLYYYLLGRVFDKFDLEDNCQYIVPFLFNAMFMHSLLNGRWLIFFVLILSIPQKKGRMYSLIEKIQFPAFRI